MKKTTTFIWGTIQLILASILVGLIFYFNAEFKMDLGQTAGQISKVVFIPLITIMLIIGYVLNISGGIKLVLTSFSKSKTIKIMSIILVIIAIALLCFYGHNVAKFINLIQM